MREPPPPRARCGVRAEAVRESTPAHPSASSWGFTALSSTKSDMSSDSRRRNAHVAINISEDGRPPAGEVVCGSAMKPPPQAVPTTNAIVPSSSKILSPFFDAEAVLISSNVLRPYCDTFTRIAVMAIAVDRTPAWTDGTSRISECSLLVGQCVQSERDE